MKTRAATPERRSARERLLTAAEELFYEEGVNVVGIDRVIERAGVAKASLYDCFGSKEELIRSYLQARHEARRERLEKWLERYAAPRDKVLGVFELLGELARDQSYRGCAFIRASAEAKPGSSIKTVCDQSRAWLREVFAKLSADAGAKDPARLADQLMLLYDGASVAAHMDRSGSAAESARSTAAVLLDAAT